ncbi:MAG: acyltransferase [Chromatiaceae bacterium]|nr:acyltransferase [Chromatiaceae bacterium]
MYKSLQAARAFAAIFVVLFHLGGSIAAKDGFGFTWFSVPFSFGGAGVEFFFVLSGFIILTAHWNDISKPRRVGSYFRKRLIRIYPTYWIIFVAALFLSIISNAARGTVPYETLSLINDPAALLKALFLLPQAKYALAPIILVAWTLHYEMFFYFCFSTLILSRWIAIALGILLLYTYILYMDVSRIPFPFSFLSKTYIFLFFMGMIVAFFCKSKRFATNRPRVYVFLGAVMFFFISLDIVIGTHFLGNMRTISYGLASSLIIYGLVKTEDSGKAIGGHPLVQLLGDSSYALYLIHYPLIGFLCKLALLAHLNRIGITGAVICYLSIFTACIIISVAFHLRIEKPLIAYLNRKTCLSG